MVVLATTERKSADTTFENLLNKYLKRATQATTTMSAAIQRQMDAGAVFNHVSNVCPVGTKFHLLEVGWLECDEGFVVRGGNTSLNSNKDQSFVNKRRQLPMYCILIDHPIEGVILWETGEESRSQRVGLQD